MVSFDYLADKAFLHEGTLAAMTGCATNPDFDDSKTLCKGVPLCAGHDESEKRQES